MRGVWLTGLLGILSTFIVDTWADINHQTVANTFLLAINAFVLLFTVRYGIWSNWRSNRIGRIYFAKCIVLSLVLTQASVSVWWDGDYPFRHEIRTVIYGLGAIAYVTMNLSLWREQRRDQPRTPLRRTASRRLK